MEMADAHLLQQPVVACCDSSQGVSGQCIHVHSVILSSSLTFVSDSELGAGVGRYTPAFAFCLLI